MEEAADGHREETTEQPTVNTEVVARQKKHFTSSQSFLLSD